MPKGLQRRHGGGELHYIICSCYQRQAFLGSANPRDIFLKTFEEVRQRYEIAVIGYVVMQEYFHLLISEPGDGNVSLVMQVLKQRVSRQCLNRGRSKEPAETRKDPFWHTRFYDFNVFTKKEGD
ncbi:MAG TPA: transposase [Candidatus Sulfotelmatobacter sp.]|nr:transposase [Candidatus Sulfotelmatobacter sp.]